MDEGTITQRLIKTATPEVPAELAGHYLAGIDWQIGAETYWLISRAWARHRGCLAVEPGRAYLLLPDPGGEWLTGVLAATIPAHPDNPEPEIFDAFGLWQARWPGHSARWLLLDDRWIDSGSLRSAD